MSLDYELVTLQGRSLVKNGRGGKSVRGVPGITSNILSEKFEAYNKQVDIPEGLILA